jgi:hypothetical protein
VARIRVLMAALIHSSQSMDSTRRRKHQVFQLRIASASRPRDFAKIYSTVDEEYHRYLSLAALRRHSTRGKSINIKLNLSHVHTEYWQMPPLSDPVSRMPPAASSCSIPSRGRLAARQSWRATSLVDIHSPKLVPIRNQPEMTPNLSFEVHEDTVLSDE